MRQDENSHAKPNLGGRCSPPGCVPFWLRAGTCSRAPRSSGQGREFRVEWEDTSWQLQPAVVMFSTYARGNLPKKLSPLFAPICDT